MRWRTLMAVAALSCQIGARIPITSALVTSETGISPMRGKTWRSKLLCHSRAWLGERQPGRNWFQTLPAASANVGIDSERRLSARGSPPSRASFRFANAFSRASFSDTRGKPPSPSSVRRPRITTRWTQPRLPVGRTSRYRPFPSQHRPARLTLRTKAGVSALWGWRPRCLRFGGRFASVIPTIIYTISWRMQVEGANRHETVRILPHHDNIIYLRQLWTLRDMLG